MTVPLKLAKDYKQYEAKSKIWWPGMDKPRPRRKPTVTFRYADCETVKKPKLHLAKRKEVKTSELSLSEASRAVGKTGSYFKNMEKESPRTFRAMKLLGKGDIAAGYRRLDEIKKEISNEYLFYIQGHNMHELERLTGVTSGYSLKRVCMSSYIKRYQALFTAKKIIRAAKKLEEKI